jgi:UDP-N-acetyl-D-galactosamine dehydrogenase
MGLAFKENCPDLRNTRVVDIIEELQSYNANVDIYDPWVSGEEAEHEYGLKLTNELKEDHYDAIIVCVGHNEFREMGADAIRKLGKEKHVLFDVKHILPKESVDARL